MFSEGNNITLDSVTRSVTFGAERDFVSVYMLPFCDKLWPEVHIVTSAGDNIIKKILRVKQRNIYM